MTWLEPFEAKEWKLPSAADRGMTEAEEMAIKMRRGREVERLARRKRRGKYWIGLALFVLLINLTFAGPLGGLYFLWVVGCIGLAIWALCWATGALRNARS